MSAQSVLDMKYPEIAEICTGKISGWTGKIRKTQGGNLTIRFEWETCSQTILYFRLRLPRTSFRIRVFSRKGVSVGRASMHKETTQYNVFSAR